MKTIIIALLMAATLILPPDIEADSALSEYTISSGTYANGDAPFNDIPFIKYRISVPSDWTAKESDYWDNEAYYTFHEDKSTSIYAGESYLKSYMDATTLSPKNDFDISTLEFDGYIVKLWVMQYNDGCRYNFFIPVDDVSYCRITGHSPKYTEEQQDVFFDIVKTFKIVE